MKAELVALAKEWARKSGVFRKRGEDAIAEDDLVKAAKWIAGGDVASHCARELLEVLEGQETT